jgi:outer membrane protein assembly factor BamB
LTKYNLALILLISIILIQLYCISAGSAGCVSSNADWTMFRGNLNHTGLTTNKDSTNSTKLLWKYATADSVWSSPAVTGDRVFVGSKDGHIYCLNSSTGKLIWKFGPAGGEVDSSPAVDDRQVYVGADDGFLYCLNITTGYPSWIKWVGWYALSSPAVLDGRVYVGSGTKNLLCFNATDGSTIWSYATRNPVHSSPAVANGVVYFTSDDDSIYAVNASSGIEIWQHYIYSTLCSPSVYNGSVYVGSYEGRVYDLNASTGAQIWAYQTQDEVASSPAVAYGCVYVGSEDNNLYCLNASTGQKIWNAPTGYWVWSSPAAADGNVYVGSDDCDIYCFNAYTGAKEWSFQTGNYVDSSPAVLNDTLYVGSFDNNVYALTLYNSTADVVPYAPNSLAWNTIAFDATAGVLGASIIFGAILYVRMTWQRLKRERTVANIPGQNLSWFSTHIGSICFLAVLAFSSIFFIVISTGNLGNPYLWSADEQTYSQMAFHMIKSQDYLVPWSFGALSIWTGKPPLFMWLIALSYQVFGINNFSTRVWAAVFGTLSLVVVFFLGKKLYNVYVGFLSALVLGTFTTFFAFATHAMLDVPVLFFMLATMYFLLLSEKTEKANLYVAFSGVFFGLALMTKQIEALLIPLIIVAYFVITKKSIRFLFKKRLIIFLGVALLVVAPWVIYMNLRFGGLFWQSYLVYSDVTRAMTAIEGHGHSYLYYFDYLATSENLLWVILLPLAAGLSAFNSFIKRSKGDMLVLIWMAIVLAIFTFAQTKITYYILPAYPAFALAIGSLLFQLSKKIQVCLHLNQKQSS